MTKATAAPLLATPKENEMPLTPHRREEKSNALPPLLMMVNQARFRVETKRMKREKKVKSARQNPALKPETPLILIRSASLLTTNTPPKVMRIPFRYSLFPLIVYPYPSDDTYGTSLPTLWGCGYRDEFLTLQNVDIRTPLNDTV